MPNNSGVAQPFLRYRGMVSTSLLSIKSIKLISPGVLKRRFDMLKTRCETADAFPTSLTSTFPLIVSMPISPSRLRVSMRKSCVPNSQRSKRRRITTESCGCTQGKLREMMVSNVPTIVSFPLFSCAKSQNVKSSILISIPQSSRASGGVNQASLVLCIIILHINCRDNI